MPSETLEEYLEAIYKLGQRGPVRPAQLAEAMSVSAPTVTNTLKRLGTRGLVERQGTTVVLTPEGLAAAVDVIRRHRVAERFLSDILGLKWDEIHEEACRLEHALSPRVLEAMERVLGDPEACPHGHPIPTSEGHVFTAAGIPLAELQPGQRAVVVRVAEEDEAMLGYLGELELFPGAIVCLVEAAPFSGPLTIEIAERQRSVGPEVARAVTVVPLVD